MTSLGHSNIKKKKKGTEIAVQATVESVHEFRMGDGTSTATRDRLPEACAPKKKLHVQSLRLRPVQFVTFLFLFITAYFGLLLLAIVNMSVIGSLIFCTDCGNLLRESTGNADAILHCDVCGTRNKGE
jgi:hypothetical protein